ncbi:SafA/ExsA family spore coat assembly protein [Bacillus velezensis]|uniref:spore coat assembly protein SafA n=1 Tax=Bacillus velezensis TaxID=492670 RepID=UPI0011207510|nr:MULTISPECIES: spore coat assembly protein SafA [Bacillus amyloliquefaciens group]MED2999261.1 SafA/ExsA family spore coat assembly protein [Bacillus velezensis]TNU34811.1 SafA/ExsA family spore coat assembly protein [Bacillus velezensis]WBL38192.1 SafA/ExsA family spore coat assembly protein [Bacillus velezensis]WEU36103.1 SafA/ExsA family spore coat assembly protein [Bacillus amyloliquefaciens]
MKIHIVQKGDSLWKIAEKYGVDLEELKKLNHQLSNPDLIMPGMKIKVPSEAVPVRKEPKAGFGTSAHKHEHPYAKEKPKSVVDIEDTIPEEPKPSIPYVPPIPEKHENVLPEADMNQYYPSNQLFQPWSPPKPEEPVTHFVEPKEKEHDNNIPQQEEMINMENANYPNMPKAPEAGKMEEENAAYHLPNMPNIPNVPFPNMPAVEPPFMHYPMPCMPCPCPVPVTPMLPGSGLCHPCFPVGGGFGGFGGGYGGFPVMPMPLPYGFHHHGFHHPGFGPQAGYGEYENQAHENAEHYDGSGSGFGGAPYGQMPYYGGYSSHYANAPHHDGKFKDDDCGCHDSHHHHHHHHGSHHHHANMPVQPYPNMGANAGYFMPYGGANPNAAPNQPSPNQVFGRPEEEED